MNAVFIEFTDHVLKLAKWRDRLSKTLDVQIVASHMITISALDDRDLQSITARRCEPIKAAEELLDIVRNQPDVYCFAFLEALKTTGHQHIYKLLQTGNVEGMRRKCTILMLSNNVVKNHCRFL